MTAIGLGVQKWYRLGMLRNLSSGTIERSREYNKYDNIDELLSDTCDVALVGFDGCTWLDQQRIAELKCRCRDNHEPSW